MQFSIGRLLKLVVVVAVISWLFAYLAWPLVLKTLCELNGLASVWFLVTGRRRLARMAIVAAILMLATLLWTDWGLSPLDPVVHVAWSFLVAASVAEVTTIVLWLVSVPLTPRTRSFEAIEVNDAWIALTPPGYMSKTSSFRDELQQSVSPDELREWAMMQVGRSHGSRIRLEAAPALLCATRDGVPSYVSVEPGDNVEEPYVLAVWGGGFGHWGLKVGSPSFRVIHDKTNHYVEWEPGIYCWHEIQ
jgi:hypothetical protein